MHGEVWKHRWWGKAIVEVKPFHGYSRPATKDERGRDRERHLGIRTITSWGRQRCAHSHLFSRRKHRHGIHWAKKHVWKNSTLERSVFTAHTSAHSRLVFLCARPEIGYTGTIFTSAPTRRKNEPRREDVVDLVAKVWSGSVSADLEATSSSGRFLEGVGRQLLHSMTTILMTPQPPRGEHIPGRMYASDTRVPRGGTRWPNPAILMWTV